MRKFDDFGHKGVLTSNILKSQRFQLDLLDQKNLDLFGDWQIFLLSASQMTERVTLKPHAKA